jgi:sortase (surface protein transpeptidase)
MPQIRGPRARWALVGAMALSIATASGVLGESVMSIELRVSRPVRPAPTLAANLDRSTVAKYRELARVTAVAALEARERIAAEAAAKAKTAQARTVTRFHLWIPSLSIDRPVLFYRCGRTSEPANFVYRWGCAGRNNTYLLGHAWGVFKALHDAYTSGQLRKGMVAYYADGYGRVTRYQVTAWQVVWPWDAAWALAAQPRPSMTLQTCVGGNSQYRLDVRLVSF